jgi:polar amino acid transport system ATP-binding protein
MRRIVCLIGPSGSGKSTLLRCTNGLETIDGGNIEFEGTRLPRDERAARGAPADGRGIPSFELFPHLTAQQNVAGAAHGAAQAQVEADRRACVLARSGLPTRPNLPPLSGGQQQRVAIARALAMGRRHASTSRRPRSIETIRRC